MSNKDRSVPKLASVGLASAMLTSGVINPAVAAPAVAPDLEQYPDLQCTVTTAAKPADAPTAEEIAAAQQKVTETEETKNTAVADAETTQAQADTANNAVKEQQMQLDLLNLDSTNKRDAAEKELARVKAALVEAKKQADADDTRAKQELAAVNQRIDSAKATETQAQVEETAAQNEVAEKTQAAEAATQPADRPAAGELPTPDAIRDRITNLDNDITQLSTALEAANTQRDELVAKETQAQEELAAAETANQQAQAKLAEVKAQGQDNPDITPNQADIDQQISDTETELAQTVAAAQAAQNAEQAKRDELTALENEISALQQKIQADQETLTAKNAERARLQQELDALNQTGAPSDDTFTRAELVPPAAGAPADAPVELKANREIALANMAKLLPFASEAVRTRAANLLADTDPLVTKRLTSVVATSNGQIIGDAIATKPQIDGILLHYGDRTVERRAVKLDDRQPTDGEVGHYYMDGGVPFTPDQRLNPNATANAALAEELKAVEWTNITPNPAGKNSAAEQRGLLYLEDAYNAQKDGLQGQLDTLLARESVVQGAAFDKAAAEAKIRAKKEAFLLGLAYVNRFYNVQFGDVNLRDVLVFRRDFYGVNESAIDLLIRLGSDYKLLTPSENIYAYNTLHKPMTGRAELANALDDLRTQFTKFANFDDWFKSTTKAYIVETPSLQVPDRNVHLSQRLRNMGSLKNVLLPILTVPENTVFATVDMSNISFGSFERYVDKTKPVDAEVARVKDRVVDYAKRYRDYYDMWYRVGNDTMKQGLMREIVTWDSLMNPNKTQTPKWGNTWNSVINFFGPIGRWFRDNNSYAYANGSMTWMVDSGILEPGRFGPATFIHEQTHNMDGNVMLGGYGRRQGAFMELYAKSFLENPFNGDYDVFGFNQVDRFDTSPNKHLYYNSDPSRFQNTTDLNQYFKGWFEALYLLDNAEATAMLERSDAEKARMFLRLGSTPQSGNRHVNSYELVSEADIAAMGLNSIEDLVEHEMMVHRQYGTSGPQKTNGYYNNFLFSPIYGTGESDLGLTGETAFRRNAYEMLSAKGFEDGWVPYVSNKLREEAVAAGQPNLPDTFIMPKVFAAEGYTSLKEYRKAAYRKTAERAATMLKPVTVNFNGQNLTFNNYDELAAKFRETVADDLRNGNENRPRFSKTLALKKALFNALVRQTDEFRTSIFTDGDASLQPWIAPAAEPAPAPFNPTLLAQPENEIHDARFDAATLPVPATTPDEDAAKEQRRAELEAQIAQLNTEIKNLEDGIQAAQTQLVEKQAEKDTKAAQLRDLQAETQRLNARKAELERRLTVLRHQQAADVAAAELAKAQQAAEEATAAATSARDKARETATNLAATQDEKTRLSALAPVLDELATARTNLVAAKTKVAEASAALAAAEAEQPVAAQAALAAEAASDNANRVYNELKNETVASLLADISPARNYGDLQAAIESLHEVNDQLATAETTLAELEKIAAEQNQLAAEAQAKATAAQQVYTDAVAARDALLARKAEIDAMQDMVDCVSKDQLSLELPIFEIPANWLNQPSVESAQPGVKPAATLPATGATVGLLSLTALASAGTGLLLVKRRKQAEQ